MLFLRTFQLRSNVDPNLYQCGQRLIINNLWLCGVVEPPSTISDIHDFYKEVMVTFY